MESKMELKLKKYAKLLVEVGVNIQKGQRLVINCPVECAEFARLCISAAYDAGCSEVVMNWSDDFAAREKYVRADSSVFETYPLWQKEFLNGYAREGAAFLFTALASAWSWCRRGRRYRCCPAGR